MYSNVNRWDSVWNLKNRWDFGLDEMGTYDIPAFVDKILEVTEVPKITMMAYSLGTASAYYGLAKKQDYFADRINRFVSLASCAIITPFHQTYEEEVKRFMMYDKLGFYNGYAKPEDASSANSDDVCKYIGPTSGDCYRAAWDYPKDANSMKTIMHLSQIYTEKRFQES